ncbi:hypothetical protein B0T22DRAFT_436567 [Podospora appendiculata]|uniref:Glucose-methanol-choline oxidoreductase N-terminal domain-containing protein n=1 Tax=Podospora appendiculata TaxID=314037 RepID=A0AAE0XHK2_9PEZI|nr:hypothetical protein B0T22DRAFT_436567 [Podospora appendiculata]
MATISASEALGKPFDFIIVGGGTAGLVVASRLSEDPNVRVLVVEAGTDRSADPLVLTPGLVAAVYGNEDYDWNFSSVPQPHLHNRRVNQARGKMLGGSSALNFMMLLYPSRGIIDAWGALGNPAWTFDALAPYYRKFATVHPPPASALGVVGQTFRDDFDAANNNGPLQVSFSEGYNHINEAWMKTFADLGLQATTDPRAGEALGAFQNAATIDPATKTRSYAATAYYPPSVAQRPNLVVLTSTLVRKILLTTTTTNPTATGIELVTAAGEILRATATSEIILAAGALHTPQILELSGIGNPSILAQHAIPVIVANPNVGENMQDHPIVCQSFEVNDGVPSGDVLRDPALIQALVGLYQADGAGAGPMGQSNISVAYAPLVDNTGIMPPAARKALFAAHADEITRPSQHAVRSLLESPSGAAVQYLLFPTQITVTAAPASMAEYILPTLPRNFLTVMTVLNHPLSRGSVHITGPDVGTLPAWDPRYNDNKLDMEVLARGVQFVEKIIAPETPLGGLFKQGAAARIPAIVPGDELEQAREIVRQRQISVFHVSGSCAMLPREEGGVVDERLQVYGVRGLRVVDASIFPLEPLGNIQSTVYAVAERAADFIKEDYYAAAAGRGHGA